MQGRDNIKKNVYWAADVHNAAVITMHVVALTSCLQRESLLFLHAVATRAGCGDDATRSQAVPDTVQERLVISRHGAERGAEAYLLLSE